MSGTRLRQKRRTSSNVAHRYQRLLVQGMDRTLLSREAACKRDAALLRRAFLDGRDQQHVLSHAGGGNACAMGGGSARAFMFTLKAPRRITHDMRLREAESAVSAFVQRAGA